MNARHRVELENEGTKRLFDGLAEEILNVSDQIFPPTSPVDSAQATFELSERVLASKDGSGSSSDEVTVCPKARLHESMTERPKVFKCRCCCVGQPHSDDLAYKLIKWKSLLIEELHPDGPRTWCTLALKPQTLQVVLVRLSDVLPIYFKDIETLSMNIAAGSHQIVTSQGTSTDPAVTKTAAPRSVEMIRSDWGFPSTKIVNVVCESADTQALMIQPSHVTLKHHFECYPPLEVSELGKEAPKHLHPQPYSCIFVKGSRAGEQDWEVQVSIDSKILHEANPLGRLVVTVQKTDVILVATQDMKRQSSDVQFYFDTRDSAECFASYVRATRDRLWDMFVRGPLRGERIVYSRELLIPTGSNSDHKLSLIIVCTPKALNTKECQETYRAIASRDKYAGTVCFGLNGKSLDGGQGSLVESLPDLKIWTSDYDANEKSVVTQMRWEELIKRGTQHRSLRATFIKSTNERTAGDWLDEVDDLIRAMRGDRNDPYERVKIAIIDSGLHDRERGRYRAECKDFTGDPTNDSWHGTCCAGIIQGVYEEARLYIARVFEKDHADEIEGPLRMAKAVLWAIEPPRSVDIISISAGFRNYSKELDDAITRARAAGVLVIAAASNWQNTNNVAFPARHNLSTMCIYSTNTGNQSSSFNPEPRADTQNFAILGEGFQHPDQGRNERMSGTSMATAVAAGLAARIVDFSRQSDNKASIFRAQDVGKLPGMLSIFSTISKPAGNLRYISPLELLPLRHGVSREADRQRVREVVSQAMERAN